MVDKQEFGKEVTAAIVAWVIQEKLNSRHFLSSSISKDMVEIEDTGQREMETIGSRVKGTLLKEGQNISMDIDGYYVHCSTN